MQHQIYPDRFNDDGEFVPAVIVEVPDILYLQVVDEGDCEDWPAPSEPSERTFTTERLNASDVAYVPAERAERAEAEAAHYRAQLSAAEEAALECQREAAALRADLDAVRDAAHVPDDWPHGLPSWVNQRLYAAYIGAAFSPQVLEQIRTGRLTFPEAPIYAKAAALRAELDAAVREVEGIFDSAAETELRLNATIDALRAERDAARGYEIHAITGSTSAGRRQRDAGKARRSDEDQL